MKKYFLFFILSLTIYVAHALYIKHAIYGDGNGYYTTSQSLLYDHTLNSPRILDHLSNFQGRDYVFSRVFWDVNKSPYSVGTSLVWIPSLALASVASSNPLDFFHEIAAGVTGIVLILAGLYFLEIYLAHFYSPRTVAFTITSLFLGSNIFYYTAFEPALSHQPAFFVIAFLLYWTHNFKYSKLNLFLLGLLFGFLPTIRIVDTILLFPFLFLLKLDIRRVFYIFLGVIVGYLPQLGSQYFYFGTIFKNFYVTESVSQWSLSPGHILEYLFSPKRGLFVWSPIYLLGFYCLIKQKKVAIIISIITLWLIGSLWSGYSSAGFGQRLSFSAIPYFALGIAYLYNKLKTNHHLMLTLLFITWNIFLLYGFYVLKWKNLA